MHFWSPYLFDILWNLFAPLDFCTCGLLINDLAVQGWRYVSIFFTYFKNKILFKKHLIPLKFGLYINFTLKFAHKKNKTLLMFPDSSSSSLCLFMFVFFTWVRIFFAHFRYTLITNDFHPIV